MKGAHRVLARCTLATLVRMDGLIDLESLDVREARDLGSVLLAAVGAAGGRSPAARLSTGCQVEVLQEQGVCVWCGATLVQHYTPPLSHCSRDPMYDSSC